MKAVVRRALAARLDLGGSSSAASEALTVAPPSPVVKERRWPLAERLDVEAEQARRRRGARYCFAKPSAGRCHPSATAWRSWPRPTSATSGECSSPAPPTTLLVFVGSESHRPGRHDCCSSISKREQRPLRWHDRGTIERRLLGDPRQQTIRRARFRLRRNATKSAIEPDAAPHERHSEPLVLHRPTNPAAWRPGGTAVLE